MKYVIDSSVGVKWVIPEVDSAKALRLRDDYRNAVIELLAPDFYLFEVANSITRAERQGRITQAEGAMALRDTVSHIQFQAAATRLRSVCANKSALLISLVEGASLTGS